MSRRVQPGHRYYCPPGSHVMVANPSWLDEPARLTFEVGGSRFHRTVGRQEYRTELSPLYFTAIHSDLPLVVEWFLELEEDGEPRWYTSNAATELHRGIFAGRWVVSTSFDTRVLTIQDRSSKKVDPGYSVRPLMVSDYQGNRYGPSEVMELGPTTIHNLREWWRIGDKAEPLGTGQWAYDFEWAPGAAWSLVRHTSGTDTKAAQWIRGWHHNDTKRRGTRWG